MLKQSLPWLAMAVFAAVTAQAQEGRWVPAEHAVAKYMLSAERQWEESACDHNRVAETILADDFWGTLQDGAQYGKGEEVKATLDTAKSARECRTSDMKVRAFGDNLVIVYGKAFSVRKGEDGRDVHQCLIFTDTWLKRRGKWQIVASHDTELPCSE